MSEHEEIIALLKEILAEVRKPCRCAASTITINPYGGTVPNTTLNHFLGCPCSNCQTWKIQVGL